MTWFPFGNLRQIRLIWWHEVKWVKDEQIWSVATLSRIQQLKKERNLLLVCIVMLEGIIET